ncbi:MAG: shikimate dehydrogenase family protein [Candidatus Limnocylindria bacterium]
MPVLRLPIIGQPLGHTPLEGVLRDVFAAGDAEIEIERWERKPHLLPDAVAELRGGGFAGALIASPHKEKAATLADALADDARASGAVNVLNVSDGKLRGDNTDLVGVRAGLEAVLPRVKGQWPKQAVVLGAGGGARAVVAVLIGAGFGHITVFNRHLHKAEALVVHFARSARNMDLRARPWHEAIIEAELSRAPLVVNASGVGSEGGDSPIPVELLPDERYLLDLVLSAKPTPLMDAASERGGTVANGQASFLAGTAALVHRLIGQETPTELIRTALARELGLPEEGLAVVGD